MKRIVRNGVGLIVLLGTLGAIVAGISGWHSLVGPAVLTALGGRARGTMSHAAFGNYAFTAWVFVFVSASLFYPQAFKTWMSHDLKGLIVPLIQIIMFGMGTTLSVGVPLALACMLHNATGYVLGYWGARLAGLNECDSRTVAIEVGMQNSGMASGLAMNLLNSPKTALAAAIFGPWMNTSGSILATWWRGRPMATKIPDMGNERMTNVEIKMSKE